MTGHNNHSRVSTGLATAGAVVVVAACCAGPAMVAAGALAAVGGLLRNPWMLAAAAVVLLAAVAYILSRVQQRRAGAGNRCRPASGLCDPTERPAARTPLVVRRTRRHRRPVVAPP